VQPQKIAPPFDSVQRPSTPPVQSLSLVHMPMAMNMQLPLERGCVHSESSGRWFMGTRPPSGPPLDEPLLDPLEPLDDPLDDPLELPLEAPLEPPELDELPPSPASPPVNVVPPHAQSAATATSPRISRRMSRPPSPTLSNENANGNLRCFQTFPPEWARARLRHSTSRETLRRLQPGPPSGAPARRAYGAHSAFSVSLSR
jgi:hypothetical protein